MALDLANFEDLTQKGVRQFWSGRSSALENDVDRAQGGERAGVLGGKNMDGFHQLIAELVTRNGLGGATIHAGGRLLTLPGYFRPTKLWDVLVMDGPRLVAAIELKSQVGPSFGNNFNNRTEEAIGTAHDLWTAIREQSLGDQPRPYIAWLILVEDCEASRKPVRDTSPHFRIFPEFQGASYLKRYDILCRRMMQEGLYTQATVMTSPRAAGITGDFGEMSSTTNMQSFAASFAGHIAAWSAMPSR